MNSSHFRDPLENTEYHYTVVPKPAPPYQWSRDLMRQIAHIEGDSMYSCYWIFPEFENGSPVFIDGFSDHMRFLILRHRAMSSGDAASIAGMFKLLLPYATSHRYSETQLRSQLSKEYGIKLDRAVLNALPDPSNFTDYEKEMAMMFTRQYKFAQLKTSGKMMTLRPIAGAHSRGIPVSR